MNVAVDISPITDKKLSSHKVRGVGSYVSLLYNNLTQYAPQNSIQFISQVQEAHDTIDLIHYPYFDLFRLQLPFFKDKELAVTIHDLTPIKFPTYFPAGFRGNVFWNIERLLAKNLDVVITDSKSSKKDIVKIMGIPEKLIHVVYLAANERYRKLEKNELDSDISAKFALPKKYLLYVGDATWNKNLPRIVAASKKAGIPLVMVGRVFAQKKIDQNPWNEDLRTVLKIIENDTDLITPGFIAEDDLNQLYNKATGLLMPSLYEGFGLPILEAMQAGCPVITSEKGSIPEVGGEAVIYTDAEDIDSISQDIRKLYESESLQKNLQEKGLAQSQKFTIEKMMKNTLKAYESA